MNTQQFNRALNFNGDQCSLPEEVLQVIKGEWYNAQGTGVSMLEMFNKNPKFLNLMSNGEKSLRNYMKIPPQFRIFTMIGGQAVQIAAVPLNLLQNKASASYILNGYWSQRAIDEAKKYVPNLNVVSHLQKNDQGKNTLSQTQNVDDSNAYLYYASADPVEGFQFKNTLKRIPNVLMVADLSADFLTKTVNWDDIDVAFASSEYQCGIAGSVVLIIRESVIQQPHPQCPYMLDYQALKQTDGVPNTVPVFPMYVNALMYQFAEKMGTVEVVEGLLSRKAERVYQILDQMNEFYVNQVQREYRSNNHIVFGLHDQKLNELFAQKALEKGIVGLNNGKNYQTLRISLNIGTNDAAIDQIVQYMKDFAQEFMNVQAENSQNL